MFITVTDEHGHFSVKWNFRNRYKTFLCFLFFPSEIPDDDRGVQRQSSENHVSGRDVCRARVCARFNLLPACKKGRRL